MKIRVYLNPPEPNFFRTRPITIEDSPANGTELTPVHVVQGDVVLEHLGELHDLVVVGDAGALLRALLDLLVEGDEVGGRAGRPARPLGPHFVKGLLKEPGVLNLGLYVGISTINRLID